MPHPSETTITRDAMLTRMRLATPGGPMFDEAQAFGGSMRAFKNPPGVIRQSIEDGKRVVIKTGGKTLAVFEPVPAGSVLAACLRETARDTFEAIETAVKPYSNVGAFGVSPDHRWRDHEGARPFHVIGAIAAAIDARPVTDSQVAAARAVLPGVAPELVRGALEEARRVQAQGI